MGGWSIWGSAEDAVPAAPPAAGCCGEGGEWGGQYGGGQYGGAIGDNGWSNKGGAIGGKWGGSQYGEVLRMQFLQHHLLLAAVVRGGQYGGGEGAI